MPVGASLYYFASGAENVLRPPVILIHGAGGHHLYWPPQIRRLHDQRMFAPDLPGHGKSSGLGHQTIDEYTRGIIEFIKALRLNAAVLVGHSMGSAIALQVAIHFPKRVLGLGLLGSGARLRVAPDILRASADASTFASAVRMITERSFAPRTSARLREIASQRMAEIRPPVLHGDFLACDRFDVLEHLSRIAVPTLIACGAEDKMTPRRHSEYLLDHIAGSRLEIVPDAGHMAMLEQPDYVASLLTEFLNSIHYRPGE